MCPNLCACSKSLWTGWLGNEVEVGSTGGGPIATWLAWDVHYREVEACTCTACNWAGKGRNWNGRHIERVFSHLESDWEWRFLLSVVFSKRGFELVFDDDGRSEQYEPHPYPARKSYDVKPPIGQDRGPSGHKQVITRLPCARWVAEIISIINEN